MMTIIALVWVSLTPVQPDYMVPSLNTVQQRAELAWYMAESAGANSDAAYEDAIAEGGK